MNLRWEKAFRAHFTMCHEMIYYGSWSCGISWKPPSWLITRIVCSWCKSYESYLFICFLLWMGVREWHKRYTYNWTQDKQYHDILTRSSWHESLITIDAFLYMATSKFVRAFATWHDLTTIRIRVVLNLLCRHFLVQKKIMSLDSWSPSSLHVPLSRSAT